MASISPLSFSSPLNIVSSTSSKPKGHQVSKVATKSLTNSVEQKPSHIVGNRRDVLIGLGGLFGATTLSSNNNNPLAIDAAQAAETSRGANKFPITLDSIVSVVVERPKQSRSKKEKEEEEEVLVVDGIEFDRNEAVKFDVIINYDEDIRQIGPKNTEFAGSFVSLPHTLKHGNKRVNTCLRLGLSDLLEDLEAEDDDSVLVTLVPKYGRGPVTVKGIKIELLAD